MPRFEVHVPASPPERPAAAAVRVEAEHWLGALQQALRRAGGEVRVSDVLCDVQPDGSILVCDARSASVLRIREIVARPAAPAAAPAPAGHAAASRPPPAEDVLATVFDRARELERHPDRKDGLAFLLDLALDTIGCEAGSAFTCQLAGHSLEFAVARGPRAGEIARLGLRVRMGEGIVGFCARENVALAVSEAQRDPRFHRAISKAIGHDTRSILCAPAAEGGRVLGALEVLDKRGGPFDRTDLAVLTYLAHRAAEHLMAAER